MDPHQMGMPRETPRETEQERRAWALWCLLGAVGLMGLILMLVYWAFGGLKG